MPKDTYVEVEMSYVQFAEVITSFNQGGGVPVTIRYANGRRMEECPFESKDEQFRAEFGADLRGLSEAIDNARIRARALLESKKPPTKSEKEELISILEGLATEVNSNIPFVRDMFAEQMDKTVAEAKGNIEGFIQNRMSVIANAALAQNIEALGDAAALPGLGPDGQDDEEAAHE
jgi:hypothetical protein